MKVSARGLRKVFPGGDGLHGVDLTVTPGQIHALVGLNGAGKSTLMRLLLGMASADAGEIRIGDHALASAPDRVWTRVGHLIEYPLAYGELTVARNLELSARLHGLTRSEVADASQRVAEEFGLSRYVDRRARNLSLGNRQRLGLAACLVHDPTLIVLDEPSNGLDPSGVLTLREALKARVRRDATILVSSHHLDEVARIADRITVIDDGRIIGSLDPGTPEIERAFFTLVHAHSTRDAA